MPVKRRPSGYHDHPLKDEDIANVLDAFGLRSVFSAHHILFEHPHPVMLNDRTKTARKIYVDTPSDAYFLKQVPWYCDEPSLNEFRHSWLEQLYAAGVLVPLPLRTLKGEPCAEMGGTRFTLARSVVGSAWANGRTRIDTAMRLLASLHAIPPPNQQCATNEDYFDLVADHITLAQALLREKDIDIEGILTKTFAPRLEDARQRAHEAGWTTLPKTGIHGDFSPWNLMLSADGQHALACDFDNADFGQRLHDVVESMFSFGLLRYRDQSTNFDSAARFGPIDAAAIPLNAYRGHAPLHDAETACIEPVSLAFAIEVYCLGLMRGDFDICQIPIMVDEIQRLGSEIPQLLNDQQVARSSSNAAEPDRSTFDQYFYNYVVPTGDNLYAFYADFTNRGACEELLKFSRSILEGNEAPLLITGGCHCFNSHFGHAGVPRIDGQTGSVTPTRVDGLPVLTTAQLGDSQTIVETVLRRVPINPTTPIVLAVCLHCGANNMLVDVWKISRCFNHSSLLNANEDMAAIGCLEKVDDSGRRGI